jgi:4-hydroxy-2-oxoheptanedioate aldolase
VPGIDVLLMGTNDLSAEMGLHGQFGHDRVVEAYRALIAACKKHGKYPGMGGVYTEDLMPRYIEMGVRFVLAGQDAQFMMSAATARTAFMRKISGG